MHMEPMARCLHIDFIAHLRPEFLEPLVWFAAGFADNGELFWARR